MSSVGETDNKIQQLQAEIDRKKQLLTDKINQMNRIGSGRGSNLNKFLQIVKRDYENHLKVALEEARKTQEALTNLTIYLANPQLVNQTNMNQINEINEINRIISVATPELEGARLLVNNELEKVTLQIRNLEAQLQGN